MIIAAGIVSLTEYVHRRDGFHSLDYGYYDLWHRLLPNRYAPHHTVFITVDDETLRTHPGEPLAFWSPHYARAIEVLRAAGARVVGIDFLFAVSAESWMRKLGAGMQFNTNHDRSFREQLHSGDVVLAAVIDVSGRPQLPIMDYRAVLPDFPRLDNHIGLVNVPVDRDGVTRSFAVTPYRVDPSPGDAAPPLLNFAPLLAFKASNREPNRHSSRPGDQRWTVSPAQQPIGFAGPPGTIPRISLHTLLEPEAIRNPLLAQVRDKVAIIGMDHASNQDVHVTPYFGRLFTAQSRFMNGAELHANIVETLLGNTAIQPVAESVRMLYVTILLVFSLIIFQRTHPLRGIAIATGFIALSALMGLVTFVNGWHLPAGQAHGAIALGFLVTLGLRLTYEERERTRIRELFSRHVSEDIVKVLLTNDDRPDLLGEETEVTALFTDIRRFSVYSEHLGAKKTVGLLNDHWGRICEPILANGGTIFRLSGDEMFAVFGAPVAHRDHAYRAICAALQIQAITEAYSSRSKEDFRNQGLPPFAIGVGVHTGKAVVGTVGFSGHTEYTAVGETINTASRLEGLNKSLGWRVIASQKTLNAAGSAIIVGHQSIVEVEGRKQPIQVFEIKGVREYQVAREPA